MLLVFSDWTSCVCLPVCLIILQSVSVVSTNWYVDRQCSWSFPILFSIVRTTGVFLFWVVLILCFYCSMGLTKYTALDASSLHSYDRSPIILTAALCSRGYLQLQLSSVDQCHGGVAGFNLRSVTTVFNMQWHRLFNFYLQYWHSNTVSLQIINHIFLFFAHLKAYTISQNIIPKPDLKNKNKSH